MGVITLNPFIESVLISSFIMRVIFSHTAPISGQYLVIIDLSPWHPLVTLLHYEMLSFSYHIIYCQASNIHYSYYHPALRASF